MTPDTIRIPHRLQALAATALLLEKLDRVPRSSASADQYQGLVRQLDTLLAEAEGEDALQVLLDGLPSLAELHENRHFAEAGLCHAPLDAMVRAERDTTELLTRLRRRH